METFVYGNYELPNMEIVYFDFEDIITSSDGRGENELPMIPINDWNK